MFNYMVEIENVETTGELSISVSGTIISIKHYSKIINCLVYLFLFILLQDMIRRVYYLISWMNGCSSSLQSSLSAEKSKSLNLIKKHLPLKPQGTIIKADTTNSFYYVTEKERNLISPSIPQELRLRYSFCAENIYN